MELKEVTMENKRINKILTDHAELEDFDSVEQFLKKRKIFPIPMKAIGLEPTASFSKIKAKVYGTKDSLLLVEVCDRDYMFYNETVIRDLVKQIKKGDK